MPNSKTLLRTDMELFAAALSQLEVSVWTRTADDIYVELEQGNIIQKFSPHSVKVGDSYFLREECEFYIKV